MKKLLSLIIAACMTLGLAIGVAAAEEGTLIKTGADWKFSATSQNANTIDKAFDSDPGSYWHTAFTFVDGNAVGVDGEISFTVDFGKEMEISGWRYTPRSDNGTGTILEYNVYISNDGKTFNKIYNGTFNYMPGADVVREPSTASWGNQKMKYIKIEVLNALSGKFGTAAEVQFYTGGKGSTNASGVKTENGGTSASSTKSDSDGKMGTAVKRGEDWQFSATSQNANTIDKAFDSDPGSYWHTAFSFVDGNAVGVDGEISFTVNFGKEMEISGWRYTPRSDNGTGTILEYTVYTSNDGTTFNKIYNGTFNYTPGADVVREPSTASWGNQKMKYIKIEVTKALSGAFGSAAEIEFYTGGEGTTNASGTKTEEKKSGRTASDGTEFYAKTGWKAEVNSAMGGSPVTNILDGNTGTYWHSVFKAQGTEIISHDNPPYHLYVTLPEAVLTSGISLTPRLDNPTGRILEVDVYVSDSDDGEWALIEKAVEFKKAETIAEISFAANLKVKRVWIEITKSNGGFGTLAEFDLMAEKKELGTSSFEEYIEYEREHRLYEISQENMIADYSGASWGDNKPERTLDGSSKTFWQTTELGNDFPAVLTVDLGRVYKIKEIHYLPRQTDDKHGAWLKVTVSGSTDKENWTILKEDVKLAEDTLSKAITLDEEAVVRYVEFQIDEAVAKRVSCAELNFYQTIAGKEFSETAQQERYTLKIGSPVIESEKNGVTASKELDVVPYISAGSTMIPLRGLLEEMGAAVSWNGEDKTVTVDNGTNVITLQIWSYLAYVTGTKYGDVRYTLLNPPIIESSRTFIPIRFVSEQLGYNVSWDGETQTITITK